MNLINAPIKQFLFFAILFFSIAVNAQHAKVDSLERILKTHTSVDTTRVNLLNEIAYWAFAYDPAKTKSYADQSGEISDKINYPKGKAGSLCNIGIIYGQKNCKVAIEYFQKALNIAEKEGDKTIIWRCLLSMGNAMKLLGDIDKSEKMFNKSLSIARMLGDKELIMKSLYSVSRIKTSKGEYPESIKQFQKLISIASEIGNKKMLSSSYGQIALIYSLQGNYPMALEYYLSALKIKEEENDIFGMGYIFINMANIQSEQKDFNAALKSIRKAFLLSKERKDSLMMSVCFTNFGNVYLKMGNPDALRYFQKGLAMAKNNDIAQRVNTLSNIGRIYIDRKEFDKAGQSFEEAMILAEKAELRRDYSNIWMGMGMLYYERKQYGQAMNYAQKALELAEEMKLLETQRDCYKLLSDVYAATGNFNKAYQNHVHYKSLSDTLFNKENIREMTIKESVYKYDKEKQKYEMEKVSQKLEIKSQKLIIFFLIIASILVLMLAFTIYWTNKLKKKVLKLEIDNINRELEINQKAMAGMTLRLVQNSERDANSIRMLESIEKNNAEEAQREIRSLIADYKFKSYNSNWEEFEILFEKVNSSFYDTLNEKYPTLTPNERKLCVFLKLNMSNQHISQITFQSEEALKKARLRLRKKLVLDRETNLATFIQNL